MPNNDKSTSEDHSSSAAPAPVPLDPKPFEGTPVLVTGYSGFIGRRLADRLAGLGARVHGISRRPAAPGLAAGIRGHQLDLADAEAVDAFYEEVRPRLVFHLASHVAGSRDLDLVRPTLRDNLCSTVYLMESAARHGCNRFVQVGSLEEAPADEPAAVASSPYAAAKAAAGSYARMFHHLYDLPVVIARVFMVYGPGRQDERKLVPYVIRSLLAGQTPSFSSGARPVDWIYVDDVVEGFLRMASRPGIEGRQVDLGTGRLTTVRRVVEHLFELLQAPSPPQFGGRSDRVDEQIRRADVQSTRQLLGWAPDRTVADGLAETVRWFRTHSP